MKTDTGHAGVPAVAAHDWQEVVEVQLLLTVRQAEALSRASQYRGLTAGQLARKAIAEFLATAVSEDRAGAHAAFGALRR